MALLAGRSAGGGAGWPITEVLLVAVLRHRAADRRRKLSGLPPVGMTAACLAFAAVVYAPLAALTWTSPLPSAKVLAAAAGLAVICTAVAFLLFFRLIAEVGPARASVITYINSAVAVALGVSVLGERLIPAMLGAFVLTLGGSVLATRPGQHSRPVPARSWRSPDCCQGLPGGMRLRQGRRRYVRRRKANGPDLYAIGMKSTNGRVRSRPQRTFRARLLAVAVVVAAYGRTPSTTHRRGRIQGESMPVRSGISDTPAECRLPARSPRRRRRVIPGGRATRRRRPAHAGPELRTA